MLAAANERKSADFERAHKALRDNKAQLRPGALVTDARKATDAACGPPRSPAERIKADRSPQDKPTWQQDRDRWLDEQFGALPEPEVEVPEVTEEEKMAAAFSNQNTKLASLCNPAIQKHAARSPSESLDTAALSDEEVLKRLDEEEAASRRRLAQLETRMLHVELGRVEDTRASNLPSVSVPVHGRRASSREQEDYQRAIASQQNTGVYVERADPYHCTEQGRGTSNQSMPGHGQSNHPSNPLTWGQGAHRQTDGRVLHQQSNEAENRGSAYETAKRPESSSSREGDVSQSLRAKVPQRNANTSGGWMWG